MRKSRGIHITRKGGTNRGQKKIIIGHEKQIERKNKYLSCLHVDTFVNEPNTYLHNRTKSMCQLYGLSSYELYLLYLLIVIYYNPNFSHTIIFWFIMQFSTNPIMDFVSTCQSQFLTDYLNNKQQIFNQQLHVFLSLLLCFIQFLKYN